MLGTKMAKIVYKSKECTVHNDNYHNVSVLPKAYLNPKLGKCCDNCAFHCQKNRFSFCCKHLDEICMCGYGVCNKWASQRFWWLHINPIKKFRAEMVGVEFRYISERGKDYRECMENFYGLRFNHLIQKWVKVH